MKQLICNKDINSMLYWFPMVKNLGIPIPKTEMVELDFVDQEGDYSCKWDIDKVHEAILKVGGYPAFLRTDMRSDKHNMAIASKVSSRDQLDKHIRNVIFKNECVGLLGLNYKCLVVREWLNLKHYFKAFCETPIAQEIRFFIKDGKVLCHHFYWPEDAIEFFPESKSRGDAVAKAIPGIRNIETVGDLQSILKGFISERPKPDEPENWRQLLEQTKAEALEDVEMLVPYVQKVANVMTGYWSVDFAKSEDGTWYLIDMANGYQSWHPECGEVEKE